jgi:acyl-CoA thioesterase FadM
MFRYETSVKLHQVDGAGRLFYAQLFVMAHDAWEAALDAMGLSIASILADASYILPVVHAEADYAAPLLNGTAVHIEVTCAKVGNRSFTVAFALKDSESRALATVRVTHAVVDKAGGTATAVPDQLREVLDRLRTD